MIKVFHLLYTMKGFFGVTLNTILAELVFMNIFMAVSAGFKWNPCKLLYFLTIQFFNLMTFQAFNLLVFAKKLIFCFAVIKFCNWFECRKIMTGNTVCGKGFLMVVFMTRQALSSQTQISFLLFLRILISNEFGFVTIFAFFLCMRSFQFISGQTMVKLFKNDSDHFKIPAMMVAMT